MHVLSVLSLWPSDSIMVTQNWVNIGSGNVLLPDGTKLLPKPVLTYHQWSPVTITWGQLKLDHHFPKLDWKLPNSNLLESPWDRWVRNCGIKRYIFWRAVSRLVIDRLNSIYRQIWHQDWKLLNEKRFLLMGKIWYTGRIGWGITAAFCMCFPRLQEVDLGFVLIVDRRQCGWGSIKTMLLKIAVSIIVYT